MRKKSKRILAAALSAILIWNTCEWQPQALAAGSLQRIGAETGEDDTAKTAEKESTSKESVLKASPSNASPSNAEVKDNHGESGANGAPNGTATGAEIEAFLELDEAIAVQKLSLGAKESDIILPDTLEVRMKQETLEDTQKAERELQIAAEADTEKESAETEADEDISRISGVTWKLDIGERDYPEFHGGISPQEYFEEFDEDGEPIETSDKTWNGYYEANQDYNGCAYVYTPVLPEELSKFEVADTADLPEIYVMVGDAGMVLLADAPYNLNGNYLVIDKDNMEQFNGKTITGTYHPTDRLTGGQIEGGIVIDDVEVELTIENVNISYDPIIIDNAAGILLKGKAKLNLTVKGENTLKGTYGGAGIGVEENATLIITKESTGSLTATGGGYGAAGIGGRATVPDHENTIISLNYSRSSI